MPDPRAGDRGKVVLQFPHHAQRVVPDCRACIGWQLTKETAGRAAALQSARLL